ncbi:MULTISPECIES: DMT family transporter [unclassified Roseateles]|uniref:DMT family transporter n=1 Tax=unclassified Roseateles TaxID=2626991 RepID=UPI000701CAA3|nr:MULTISPECIES: DMT family transporter [unclassified Roseateles]KQW46475.1 multidrug DMT transporter permease [Pelomonas sp. Root405]KRA73525.1 multidrug DMT transporter permease [Pelomonas sp. Root662]
MNPRQLWPGLLLAVLGAIGFSGKAIIVKLAYRHGVDPVTLLMWRMLLALPFFLAMAWWAGRGKPALTRQDWRDVAVLGFTGYYLASYLDFAGLAYISASLERLILYLNPTLVLLISVLFFQHRLQARQLIAMAVSYAGVVAVFAHELSFEGANTALGAALVFASAVSYAVYLALSGKVVKRLGSLRLAGLASTVACALCIAQFLLIRPLSAAAVPEPVLWLSLLNATACTVAPVLMVMLAIARIGAPLSSQVGMVGPMSTLIMGVLILGEPMNAWIAAGTLLVLGGVFLVSRPSRQP